MFKQTTNQLGSPTVAQHDFSKVPHADIPRSSFNRSHTHKTTFSAGFLVPVLIDEVLPGDTFKVDATFFARMATPIFPLMDNLYLDSFFFFVPNRILQTNWVKLQGAQDNPGDSISFLVPQVQLGAGQVATGDLADYMGIPTKIVGLNFSALPFRAYNAIFKQWFRDQNLQNSPVIQVDDGPDPISQYVLLRRGKRHDYFTSSLPTPQRGAAVTLPLGTTAAIQSTGSGNFGPFYLGNTSAGNMTNAALTNPSAVNIANPNTVAPGNAQTQKLLERDMRGGTRYPEILNAHFGVISPDARVQFPEYLGGGETPIQIHPVAQTAPTSGTNAQGALAAFATAVSSRGHNHGFTKSFVEHGWIIGLVSVRAELTYQQGLERQWSRRTRLDHYMPVFAHLGEQAVLNIEIFAQGTGGGTADAAAFGYQEAWAEYRYKPSRISGLFRSNATAPLDGWHLAQNFGSLPTLNTTFIQETPPMSRVEAVTTQPDFIFDSYFQMTCARPMPVYSVPGLVDHF